MGTLCLVSIPNTGNADTIDDISEFAGHVGCGLLSWAVGDLGGVAVGVGCAYGTEFAKDQISDVVDEYFEGEDQKFADEMCITIVYEGGNRIEPKDKSNCAKNE